MKPIFAVQHGSQDITALISDRLMSLRVTDEAGLTSDQFEMVVDNRDMAISIPATGAELSVAMGYQGGALYNLGRYTVDEVEASGPALTLTLRGKAADMKATLKSWKKRAWHKTTLGAIVQIVAGEHGMQAKVAQRFASIQVDHIDQTYESDLNLMTRLAEQYGAVMKPAGGYLLFVERGAGVRPDGTSLPTLQIAQTELLDWRASIHERQFYARVGAHWQDKRAAKVQYVYAGTGEPVMYIRHPYKSERDALAAADAKLRQLDRGRTALSITMRGNPSVCAEMPIVMPRLDALTAGEWIVTRAEHSLDSGGLVTKVDAQRRADIEAAQDSAAQGAA